MSIFLEKDYGGFGLECDHCLDVHDETFDSFSAAIWWVRLSNWIAETDDDGSTWTHRCPDCLMGGDGTRLDQARRMFGVVR